MKSEYKDYRYVENEGNHAHDYIYSSLVNIINKSDTILDIGCGKGFMANRMISEDGLDVYGTDASIPGIELAKKNNPNRFFIQDLASDELPNEIKNIKFNTIISIEVIEHLYDPRAFIKFCKDILIKNGGGELIISTPYHGYFKNILLSIFNKWDMHANPLWDGGHIKLWSRKTITELLEEQGFIITEFIGCGRVKYLWKSMILKAKIH